ncbi:nucleotide sugar dehydrogenase [Prochlorococcus sp. AH-716-P20]|nr:nucleotide sugar dehydrogenase [Prochlorococcus sp. AH-716-P20]
MKNQLSIKYPEIENCNICIVGLGYVGLPLAIEFSRVKNCIRTGVPLKREITGFDLNKKRIEELKLGIDSTNETELNDLKEFQSINFISDPNKIKGTDVYVVSVPTPIDSNKNPDLTFLLKASETIGDLIKRSDSIYAPIIIYESTVYPGTTEEICVPIIEKRSKLKYNKDFFCGYSPERINPGDKKHRLASIVKVTSGSNKEAADWIDALYGSIIKAGTFKAKSLKIAEAAKAIENTQRDINIALVNELAKVCKAINIDTLDVLEAAGSKWNFMPFRPGLVGGHCISVDPFYLTYVAKKNGYEPKVVLAGRKINDGMSEWIIEQLYIAMMAKEIIPEKSRILILGVTFKENCPDTRNSKVLDMIKILNERGIKPYIHDPYITDEKIFENNFTFLKNSPFEISIKFDVIIIAVAHQEFKLFNKEKWLNLMHKNHIFYDLKGILPRELNPIRL